jgi:hypothetical protein
VRFIGCGMGNYHWWEELVGKAFCISLDVMFVT